MVQFVSKNCYFVRVMSGCDSPLIASNAKIACQEISEKEFPYLYVNVSLHYLFKDNVALW